MKYKIVNISLLFFSLIQTSIIEYSNKIAQPFLNPKSYVHFTKNSFFSALKLTPGHNKNIFSIAQEYYNK